MRARPPIRLIGVVAGLAVVTGAAMAAATPVPVKVSKRNEVTPAAGGDYFVWAKSRRRHQHIYDVWAQHRNEAPFKVNAAGTTGFAGGIDGTRLVYQQVRGRWQSDIRFFDLVTRRRSTLPAGVNTNRWEWAPTVSGDWLLFGRGVIYSSSTQQIVLQNLVTGEQRVLDILRSKHGYLEAGQVNGNFAVWTKCELGPTFECDVFRYDIAALTKTPMPRTGEVFYSPSVTPSGTTYYGRNGRGCGAGAELVKTTLDGATFVLYSFPGGADLSATYAVVIPARPPTELETTRIYFERVTCSGPRFDINSIDDSGVSSPPPG